MTFDQDPKISRIEFEILASVEDDAYQLWEVVSDLERELPELFKGSKSEAISSIHDTIVKLIRLNLLKGYRGYPSFGRGLPKLSTTDTEALIRDKEQWIHDSSLEDDSRLYLAPSKQGIAECHRVAFTYHPEWRRHRRGISKMQPMHWVLVFAVIVAMASGGIVLWMAHEDHEVAAAEKEVDALERNVLAADWPEQALRFFDARRKYLDAAIAEQFNEAHAEFLARHWDTAPRLFKLMEARSDYRNYVIGRALIMGDNESLKAIQTNSGAKCPPGFHAACLRISRVINDELKYRAGKK